MALIPNWKCVFQTVQGNALYNARRCGALGLVRLASCLLCASIGLYRRQLISPQSVRVAVTVTGRLEKSALALLLGPRHIQSRDGSKPE
jgi:hypothetical protein